MKKIFMAAFLLWSVAAQATPGVIVESKGAVTVTLPGAKAAPAKVGIEFPDGATFKAGKDGAAKLMLMDGSFAAVTAGSTYKAGTKAATTQNNPGMVVAMREAVTQTGSGPTVHGMVKMVPGVPMTGKLRALPPVGGIEAVTLANTAVPLSETLSIQWKGSNLQGEKPILVFFESGQPPQQFPLTQGQKEWKEAAQKLGLQNGKEYNWYLGRIENGKPIAQSRKFVFQILSDAEKKALDAELGTLKSFELQTSEGEQFMKAQIFYQHKMYAAMVDALQSIYVNNKTSGVKRLLFLANIKLGRIDVAKKYQ